MARAHDSIAYVREKEAPVLPPPASTVGIQGWLLKNLFSSPLNGLLTVVLGALLAWYVWDIIHWAILTGVFQGTSREACLKPGGGATGACWPFVADKLPQWIYGFYPAEQRWRVNTVFAVGIAALVPMLVPSAPFKKWNAIFLLTAFPVMTFILLTGGYFGLEPVETSNWGGLLVTLVVAITGIVASLPIGIVLALGRQSSMPAVKLFSVIFIELWRGVPLITVLFFSSVMLPLFLPEGVTFDKLLRALVGVAIFAAAYMAEVVRSGLQAIPKGQYEGAMALGISYWRMMSKVILPQALKIAIPNIVGNFISLFKDTTLVSIIGVFDLLNIVRTSIKDTTWSAPSVAPTGYFTLAVIYWVFCFSMSRYSMYTERRLHTGHKR